MWRPLGKTCKTVTGLNVPSQSGEEGKAGASGAVVSWEWVFYVGLVKTPSHHSSFIHLATGATTGKMCQLSFKVCYPVIHICLKGFQMPPVHDKAPISVTRYKFPISQACLCVLTNIKAFTGTGHMGTLETDAYILPQKRPGGGVWALKVWSQKSLHLGVGTSLMKALASCKQIVKMKAHWGKSVQWKWMTRLKVSNVKDQLHLAQSEHMKNDLPLSKERSSSHPRGPFPCAPTPVCNACCGYKDPKPQLREALNPRRAAVLALWSHQGTWDSFPRTAEHSTLERQLM